MSVPLLLLSSLETCFLKYVAYQNAHLFHASVSWWDLHAEAYVCLGRSFVEIKTSDATGLQCRFFNMNRGVT